MSRILKGLLNEVNPQNYDSDIDYYNALNRKPRGRSEPDFPEEPEDPYADQERRQAAQQAKTRKEVNVQYADKEGVAPNGERYNGAFIVRSKSPQQGDNEIYKFNDAHWGAKKIVDTVKKQPDSEGEPYTTIVYYVDNHKHGYWKPWKDEPPISKGIEFTEELMREGISQEDLGDLLFHRLELRYPDVVKRYGHEVVGDIVLDVAGFHEGAEELGTSDISIMLRQIIRKLEEYANEQINELSPQTLASYKQKAGADASKSDRLAQASREIGDTEMAQKLTNRANKRFSGIVRATNKQFSNDAKGIKEGQSEGEATLAQIANAGNDGYEMIEDGLNGLLGTEAQIILQDMYNEVSFEHRLHPDDDFEQIFDRMMNRIEDDYGVNESYYDRGDYYNARMGGEYGRNLAPQELGSGHYVSKGDGEGPVGRPPKKKGLTNKLPADPFGRTSGAVPKSNGSGKIHRISGPDDVDEGMVMGVSSDASSAGSKVQGESSKHTSSIGKALREEKCPECGGPMFSDLMLAEKKDACYNKVRSRYKVWPSAYASGALVQCRKKGAANWGNKSKNEDVAEGSEQQWVVTVGTKTGGTSHTMIFSGTKEQAIKKAVARFGTSKNPVVTAKLKQQGVAEGSDPKKDVEAIRAAIARMEREIADPNPHIDRENLRQRIAWEKRRLNLYRDVEGVAEGPAFDKWADERVAANLHKLKPKVDFEQAHHDEVENFIKTYGTPGEYNHKYDEMGKAHNSYLKYPGRTVTINTQMYNGKPGHNVFTKKEGVAEEQLDEKCWDTHKQVGMKNKGGRMVPNCVPKESIEEESLDENLRKWFKEKWVRFGPDGKIRGACARGDDSEGKPKCLPQSKAHSLGKKGRASAAARKRREDPNPERSGKAINVATKKKTDESFVNFEESFNMRIDELDIVNEDWQKVNKRDKTDGMSRKAVKAYRRENPGSKLKTAVTTKPSKLKKGSKAAKRRKSFCARMKGMKKAHASAKTKRNPDSPINKALRRWNCESIEELRDLMMIAEQKVQQLREAANPAQQAAIAINMKKKGQKPKQESAIEKGIVDENLGMPYPGTYEQETAPIKRKGQQERVQSIAFESKK